MTRRLALTTLNMETTPGDRSTLTAHGVDFTPIPSNASGPFRILIGITFFGMNSENIIPVYVSENTANVGFFLASDGTISYRNGSSTPVGQLTHTLLVPTLGQKKTIEISVGIRNAISANWYVTVNGIPVGVVSGTAGLTPNDLQAFGGSSVSPSAPIWLHEYEIDFDAVSFYSQWDGSGTAAVWDKVFYTSRSPVTTFGLSGDPGPLGNSPGFLLIEDTPYSGSYCLSTNDVSNSAASNSGLVLNDLYTLNWNTTSFSFEIEIDNLGGVYFFTASNGYYFEITATGKIALIHQSGNAGFTISPVGALPTAVGKGRNAVWYFAWNHISQEVTSTINGVG